jgi:hypothetical protein
VNVIGKYIYIYIACYIEPRLYIGIATGYELDDRGVQSSCPDGFNNFHISISSRLALGQPNLLYKVYQGALFSEVKWPGSDTDHSLPSAEAKETWIYIYIPLYIFMA